MTEKTVPAEEVAPLSLERTRAQDLVESNVISQGKIKVDDGQDTGDHPGFNFEGQHIINPYRTANCFHEVEPVSHYGQAYIDWYLSL